MTLSTAESELVEVVEGMIGGESVHVILSELDDMPKIAYTDSQSALAVLVNQGGSWRTRHLRLRASYARQCIQRGEWAIQHIPGVDMIADLGTKALPAPRMTHLKELMGMKIQREEKGEEKIEEKGEESEEREVERTEGIKAETAARAIQLITLAATMYVAKGSEDEEEDGEDISAMTEMMGILAVLIIIVISFTVLITIEVLKIYTGPQIEDFRIKEESS